MGAPATAPAAPPALKTAPVRLQAAPELESFKRQRWFMKAGAGHTQDDCRSPYYFGLWAKHFSRHDIITMLADDESWELELCVERVQPTVNEVHVSTRKAMRRDGIVQNTTILAPGIHTEWRAGLGWCVIRASDNHPIVHGEPNEGNAISKWRTSQPKQVPQR